MKRIFLSTIMICLLWTCSVYATGLDFTEVGLRANAMGTAYTGVADDASAVYWNPAGLTQIGHDTVSGEIMVKNLNTDTTYKDPMGNSYDSKKRIFIPEGFISYKYNNLAIGTGWYIPYASGLINFDNLPFAIPGMGMTTGSIKGSLAYYALGFSAAYQVMTAISIGFTGEALYGVNEIESRINMPSGGVLDATDMHYRGWAGARGAAGIMIKPVGDLNIGLQLKSKVNLKMNGTYYNNNTLAGTSTHDNDATFREKLPYEMYAGMGYRITPKCLISFDLGYKWWSGADEKSYTYTDATGSEVTNDVTQKEKNNYTVAAGIEYKPYDLLKLRGGVFYHSPCADDENVSFTNIIDVSVLSFRGGVGYNILPGLEVGFDAAYSDSKIGEAKNGTGTYGLTAWTTVIGLRYTK